MPFIHVYARTGQEMETKKKAAQAIVNVIHETIGAPEFVITVAYEDIQPENWDKDVVQTIIEPLRDKVIVDHGNLV